MLATDPRRSKLYEQGKPPYAYFTGLPGPRRRRWDSAPAGRERQSSRKGAKIAKVNEKWADDIIEEKVILALKSVESISNAHKKQLLT